MKPSRVILIFALISSFSVVAQFAAGEQHNYVNSELPWHDAVLDSQGKLLAWYHPERSQGYDHVCQLAWDFMETKVPDDAKSGLKVYLVNAVYDAKTFQGTNWQGNPASTFGQFVDSVVAWYRNPATPRTTRLCGGRPTESRPLGRAGGDHMVRSFPPSQRSDVTGCITGRKTEKFFKLHRIFACIIVRASIAGGI